MQMQMQMQGGAAGDEGGVERHNQFLWAKRMGQENEPRWGLFKKVSARARRVCVCMCMARSSGWLRGCAVAACRGLGSIARLPSLVSHHAWCITHGRPLSTVQRPRDRVHAATLLPSPPSHLLSSLVTALIILPPRHRRAS
eukprot:1403755-Rhodomonas_salina.1